MSDSIKMKVTAFAAGLSCLLVAYALAQPAQPGQPDRPPTSPPQPGVGATQAGYGAAQPGVSTAQPGLGAAQPSQPIARGENSEVDQFFASCLLVKNKAEIELSKLALERAQNPQIKQFAQQMITDHQLMIPKLQQLAGTPAVTDRTRGVQPANFENQPNTPGQTVQLGQSTTTAPQPGMIGRTPSQSGGIDQVAAIEKQIAEKAYDAMRQKLEQKQGAEFDHCYLGAQIACHMQMAAALGVLKESGPGQVRQIAQEAEPKVKQHLAMAEQLGEQLMKAETRQAGLDRPATEAVTRVPR